MGIRRWGATQPAANEDIVPIQAEADEAEAAAQPPRLVIALFGTGVGEVRVTDVDTGTVLATCGHNCIVRPTEGQHLEITAATPSPDAEPPGVHASAPNRAP